MKPAIPLPVAMRTDFNVLLEKVFNILHPGAVFMPNWHLDVIAHHVREFAEGKITRLVICLPPRHLKSEIGSVALPAWILGRDPTAKIICASYGEDLAKDFSTKCRQVVAAPSYMAAFPEVHFIKSNDMHLQTSVGGERYTTTVGGAITGKGADFIIVDDPLKYQDAGSEGRREEIAKWLFNLPTRLNQPNLGGIMVIAQRMHDDDPIGRILQAGGWTVVTLPLIATVDQTYPRGSGLIHSRKAGELLHPARINAEIAAQLKSEIGSAAFEAQYQQNPLPDGAGLFDITMLKRHTTPPPHFEYTFLSVDNATIKDGGDHSVCTYWGYLEEMFYLIYVWRKQVILPVLRRTILEFDKKYNPSQIVVEAIGSGASLCQDLIEQLGSYVEPCIPTMPKAQRFEAVTLMMEKGRVSIPTDAPWLEAYVNELQRFPNGKSDDQVDSTSQLLHHHKDWLYFAKIRGNPKGPGFKAGNRGGSRIYGLSWSPMPNLW